MEPKEEQGEATKSGAGRRLGLHSLATGWLTSIVAAEEQPTECCPQLNADFATKNLKHKYFFKLVGEGL